MKECMRYDQTEQELRVSADMKAVAQRLWDEDQAFEADCRRQLAEIGEDRPVEPDAVELARIRAAVAEEFAVTPEMRAALEAAWDEDTKWEEACRKQATAQGVLGDEIPGASEAGPWRAALGDP